MSDGWRVGLTVLVVVALGLLMLWGGRWIDEVHTRNHADQYRLKNIGGVNCIVDHLNDDRPLSCQWAP